MPFARWIKNKNNRPVCVWSEDMELPPVRTSEILPLVKSGVGEVVVAILAAAPFGKRENSWQIKAKHALFSFCKLAA